MLGGAKGDCVVLEECLVLVDCVLQGASRMEQLQINMEMIQSVPMKVEVDTFMNEW